MFAALRPPFTCDRRPLPPGTRETTRPAKLIKIPYFGVMRPRRERAWKKVKLTRARKSKSGRRFKRVRSGRIPPRLRGPARQGRTIEIWVPNETSSSSSSSPPCQFTITALKFPERVASRLALTQSSDSFSAGFSEWETATNHANAGTALILAFEWVGSVASCDCFFGELAYENRREVASGRGGGSFVKDTILSNWRCLY